MENASRKLGLRDKLKHYRAAKLPDVKQTTKAKRAIRKLFTRKLIHVQLSTQSITQFPKRKSVNLSVTIYPWSRIQKVGASKCYKIYCRTAVATAWPAMIRPISRDRSNHQWCRRWRYSGPPLAPGLMTGNRGISTKPVRLRSLSVSASGQFAISHGLFLIRCAKVKSEFDSETTVCVQAEYMNVHTNLRVYKYSPVGREIGLQSKRCEFPFESTWPPKTSSSKVWFSRQLSKC